MARSDRHLRLATALVGGSLALALVASILLGWFEPLELLLYDARAKHFQHFTPPPTDRVVHADIDDAALEAVGAWPWPRSVMADMVDEMSAAGAKAIVLDVLYSEPQKPEWEPAGPAARDGAGGGGGG
ncbi:MAG TPA: CHASE2 domain-containing protein, partial [Humisphaera sp.]